MAICWNIWKKLTTTGHLWPKDILTQMFIGENVMQTDNQQERLNERWTSGFVDGEGCFHVAINKQSKMTLGFQVLPEFRVVQHQRDEQILYRMQKLFGFGNVVVNHGDRKEFRVRGLKNLNKIVSFFQRFPLQTKKQKDFEKFAQIIHLMNENNHLTLEGLEKIKNISSTMNRAIHLESSETERQTN